jgi:hypothetical protein
MRPQRGFNAVFVASLIVGPGVWPAHGDTYRFDLTEEIGSDFNNFPELVVDLDVDFAHVDSASIELKGIFWPGVVTPVTIPEHTGPLLPSDTVNLIIRLGEVGTAWIDKKTFAIQDLQEFSGAVSFDLPLLGASPTTVPVLLPNGDGPPDFGFLLDGRFGISTGSMHWVTLNLEVLEPPRFELTQFILRVDGVAVPETTGGTCTLLALLSALLSTRRLFNRRY